LNKQCFHQLHDQYLGAARNTLEGVDILEELMETLGILKRQRAVLRKSEKYYRDQLARVLQSSEEI
jgi:hypothetical protein